ncbi:hypothetical protein Godav_005404 [Gossypium davidsonii]|uniref:Uncharacterized protein n=1 Tax=Gossypium davidsonii TaxID=34287 RepID=A0A7J8TIZ0_GOSDV|nr:hypothetical protein [Gossypium davidsonii]
MGFTTWAPLNPSPSPLSSSSPPSSSSSSSLSPPSKLPVDFSPPLIAMVKRLKNYTSDNVKLPEEEHPNKAFGWTARDISGVHPSFKFSRRAAGEKDVDFKVLYCGICHIDLHNGKNEWGKTLYC